MKNTIYEPILEEPTPYIPTYNISPVMDVPILQSKSDSTPLPSVSIPTPKLSLPFSKSYPIENSPLGNYVPSKEFVAHIKRTEGFKARPYDDVGVPAIGYGFRDKSLVSKGIITEKEAEDHLLKEAQVRIKDLETYPFWKNLNNNQKDALLSLHFNIGEGKFRKESPKLLAALNAGDWKTAADEINHGWDQTYNGKPLLGLRVKRNWEKKMMLS